MKDHCSHLSTYTYVYKKTDMNAQTEERNVLFLKIIFCMFPIKCAKFMVACVQWKTKDPKGNSWTSNKY